MGLMLTSLPCGPHTPYMTRKPPVPSTLVSAEHHIPSPYQLARCIDYDVTATWDCPPKVDTPAKAVLRHVYIQQMIMNITPGCVGEARFEQQ